MLMRTRRKQMWLTGKLLLVWQMVEALLHPSVKEEGVGNQVVCAVGVNFALQHSVCLRRP
jgi:hypothetical protein